jgi:hypothetical protein
MPATIKRSAQNSNVYRAYRIMSNDTRSEQISISRSMYFYSDAVMYFHSGVDIITWLAESTAT